MQFTRFLRSGALAVAAAFCVSAQAPAPAKPVPNPNPGLPARVSPSEYQAQAKAGTLTIAAEFAGHAVPTAEGPLSSEDFVTVELAIYGPPEARAQISLEDFSLRLNGKKQPLTPQPYGVVLSSLKDPEWAPPEPPAGKGGKTSLNSGGGQGDSGPPPPVKVPFDVQRAINQRATKAALPLGDRALPVAGIVFFSYRGKTKNLSSVELLYSGPAGKATLALQP